MNLPETDGLSPEALAVLMPTEETDETQVAEARIGDLLKGMADEQRRNQRTLGAARFCWARCPLGVIGDRCTGPLREGQGEWSVLKQVPAPDTPLKLEIHGVIFLQLRNVVNGPIDSSAASRRKPAHDR